MQSKNWITSDTLDLRIREALENPVPLWGAEQQQLQQAAEAKQAQQAAGP